MTQAVSAEIGEVPSRGVGELPTSLTQSPLVCAILALWFAGITWLAIGGAFAAPAGEAPFNMILAAGTPPVLFLIAYHTFSPLKHWVRALDLAELTAMQAWRIIGAAFLFAWAVNVLPPIFAFPAGIGDILVGVAAPAAALAVSRTSAYANKAAWGIVIAGMTDFVIVVLIGIFAREAMPLHLEGQLSTMAMGEAPFVLFPAFLVPAFIILHIMAMVKLLNR